MHRTAAWCTALDCVEPHQKIATCNVSPSLCCLTCRLSRVCCPHSCVHVLTTSPRRTSLTLVNRLVFSWKHKKRLRERHHPERGLMLLALALKDTRRVSHHPREMEDRHAGERSLVLAVTILIHFLLWERDHRHPKEQSFLLSFFSRPVTPLTSKMTGIHSENARTVQAGSLARRMAVPARQEGRHVLKRWKPAARQNGAAHTWSNPHCGLATQQIKLRC